MCYVTRTNNLRGAGLFFSGSSNLQHLATTRHSLLLRVYNSDSHSPHVRTSGAVLTDVQGGETSVSCKKINLCPPPQPMQTVCMSENTYSSLLIFFRAKQGKVRLLCFNLTPCSHFFYLPAELYPQSCSLK